jgi:hypothetical protein
MDCAAYRCDITMPLHTYNTRNSAEIAVRYPRMQLGANRQLA